jgi:hypothetical protein
MSRSLKIEYAGALYHITSLRARKENSFKEKDDRLYG